jgi:CDP-glucose 4,6-dehydratase
VGLKRSFGGSFDGRRVLVTGHTGFKGSWLSLWLQVLGAEVAGLALDPEPGNPHWDLLGLDLVLDSRVDLRDARAVANAVASFKPEIVFHLAAQPLVRRGYREPAVTFDTNVAGLVNVFEAVRACASVRVVVNATTDKVYAIREGAPRYREGDTLGGHDPYSASKACAELVSDCYRASYFDLDDGRGACVRLATARAGNVIGGGDWAEDRLVPDLVRAAATGTPLQVRNPRATRPWQHVLEPLAGYLCLASAMLHGDIAGGAWNFGPAQASTLSVGDVVSRFQDGWPQLRVAADAGPHPHEAVDLALDCGKAMASLGWRPVWGIDETLDHTLAWYRQFLDDGSIRSHADLADYVAAAREAKVAWAA